MAVISEPDNTPLPGTVFTPRQVRVLKVAVIVMGLLLVGGFAFVLAAIVYQASRLKQDGAVTLQVQDSAASPIIDLPVGQGAGLTAMSLDDNRLALHLSGGDGPEIVVVDLGSGKIVARVKLKPQ